VLQRGGRGVRRGRARRLRPDRGRPLLLRQRKTCRRASRRQGAARAGRRDCAAAAVAQQRATWAAAGGAAAPAASAGSAACAGAKPCAVMATGARATAGTPTSAAPCARRGSDSYRTLARLSLWPRSSARPTQSGPPQTVGNGLGAPVQDSHGPQVPHSAAARHVRSRAAARPAPRQRLPTAGRGGPAGPEPGAAASRPDPWPSAGRAEAREAARRRKPQAGAARTAPAPGLSVRSGRGRTVAVRCRLARAAPPSPFELIAHTAGSCLGSHTRAPGHSSAVLLPSNLRG